MNAWMLLRKPLAVAGVALLALLTAAVLADAQEAPTDGPAVNGGVQTAPAVQNGLEMTQPGVFTVRWRDADLRTVLAQLSAQGQKNIVALKDVGGTVTADLYNVTFKEALEAVLSINNLTYEEEGNFIYVMTPKQMADRKAARRELLVRKFRLSYITAGDARTLIAPLLSTDGSIAITPTALGGISTSKTDAGGINYANEDVLVVRDDEETLKKVEKLLSEIDVKPDQVLIEATILRATLSEDNALGVDFNSLAGIRFENLGATSAGLTNLTTGTVGADVLGDRQGSLRTDFNSAIDAGGLTLGIISDRLAMFIRALESVTDVTVLANPKLLVVNKQRGEVMIGNRDGYITTTFTETTATQTVAFLETGTRLIVRPYVAKDGYVRMEIHPEDSSGSVAQVGNNALPSETTTEVTSNVLVRDGRTIVIGGLFRERTSNGRSQVPLAGNVPYLGALFRRTVDATVREEVIILITPHIVRQDTAEALGQRFKDDVERFRVGQRKGIQWWARGRLAQTHMSWAKQDLTRGEPCLAMWNIDMALSMQPRMIAAIRLKERLTEQAYWADQNRLSSSRFLIEGMLMQELGKPVSRIVPPDRPLRAEQYDPDVRRRLGIEPEPLDPLPGENATPLKDLLKDDAQPFDEEEAGQADPPGEPPAAPE